MFIYYSKYSNEFVWYRSAKDSKMPETMKKFVLELYKVLNLAVVTF